MLERNAYMVNKYSINITKNLNLEHVVVNATNNMKNYEKNTDMNFFGLIQGSCYFCYLKLSASNYYLSGTISGIILRSLIFICNI